MVGVDGPCSAAKQSLAEASARLLARSAIAATTVNPTITATAANFLFIAYSPSAWVEFTPTPGNLKGDLRRIG